MGDRWRLSIGGNAGRFPRRRQIRRAALAAVRADIETLAAPPESGGERTGDGLEVGEARQQQRAVDAGLAVLLDALARPPLARYARRR